MDQHLFSPTNNQWSLEGFLCYLVANFPNVSKCLLGKMCLWQNTTQVTWKIYNVSSYLDFKISYSMYFFFFLFCLICFLDGNLFDFFLYVKGNMGKEACLRSAQESRLLQGIVFNSWVWPYIEKGNFLKRCTNPSPMITFNWWSVSQKLKYPFFSVYKWCKNLNLPHFFFLSASTNSMLYEFVYFFLKENVQYGVNLDITSYVNGKRETHNPPGRALPFTVWDFYDVRMEQFRFYACLCTESKYS